MFRGQSVRSLKSTKSGTYAQTDLENTEFEDLIQKLLKQFGGPISVSVCKDYQRDQYASKIGKQKREKKFNRKSMIAQIQDRDSEESSVISSQKIEPKSDHTLSLTTHYDFLERLVEIQMIKYSYQPVPRVLMQIIALIVPYHRYLSKFVLKQCRVNMYTIYELSKILSTTNITDVCLDQSPLPECNYDILLSEKTCLRNLSLARCKINDIVCERIAKHLHYSEPGESKLVVLNLSSNNITDKGASHLGNALRSNRHLRYLNLADNHITDVGAGHILEVLIEFPLTTEERLENSKRYIEYLRKKHALYQKCMYHFVTKSEELGQAKSAKKGTSIKSKAITKKDKLTRSVTNVLNVDDLQVKAEMMTIELLGPFEGPFIEKFVFTRNGMIYCQGNLVLCYLNLAYNNLSFVSIRKLLNVVLQQHEYRTDKSYGLLNVILEGNYVPANCNEMVTLNNELIKIVSFYEKKHNAGRRKSVLPASDKRLYSERKSIVPLV